MKAQSPIGDHTSAALHGGNQVSVGQYNERLVISLLRRHGWLTKADLARMTGLSAQTMTVIVKRLTASGLLLSGDKMRGRVGQPSTPALARSTITRAGSPSGSGSFWACTCRLGTSLGGPPSRAATR